MARSRDYKGKKNVFILAGIILIILTTFIWADHFEDKINYNTQVKPILNKHCMGCHGGVKKAGNVSFLFEEDLYKPGKSGKIPVVKGDADLSEMIRLVTSHDPDERMPKKGLALSAEEISTLKKWIDQGAEWGIHWSYKKIKAPAVPDTRSFWERIGLGKDEDRKWAKNEIDQFVIEKLKENQLSPAPETDKATLIRRVSLDLTGLPPSRDDVRNFLQDSSSEAYEKVVDRLLQSAAYGERWAAMWMDLARYADTKGYERDGGRKIWRYRDYVIKSFNSNKPFSQFTVEQIAGDLTGSPSRLPTDEQLIATGFHRNTMNNDEGGTVDEEFRVAAVLDRVNTTWEVWQGTTFGCVQCHSHPYDPIRHEEYYQYLDFFNNTRDEDVASETPTLRFYKGNDSASVEAIKNWIRRDAPSQAYDAEKFMRIMEPKINAHDLKGGLHTSLLDAKYFGFQHLGAATVNAGNITEKTRLVIAIGTGSPKSRLTVRLDSVGGPLLQTLKVPVTGSPWKDSILVLPVPAYSGTHRLHISLSNPNAPDDWVMVKWIALQKALPHEIEMDYAKILNKKPDEMPVFWEEKNELSRSTHVFERGNWLVKGAQVSAAVPLIFPKIPSNDPNNRLGLAKWMVHRDNPLTAMVIVNRFWEQLFGTGLVETVEDFGSQGSTPSHQALLDHLAVRFMEHDQWRVKSLLKYIVMSATYRQSSTSNETKQKKDPYNIYLSRGPRVRLSAEQIRDQALAVSQLLSKKMYGPSVMPPQPDGIWQSPYDGATWKPSTGEDRYRRALYTYWKRTAPYPSMMTFDSPTREFCQSRRIRTNTPLQALTTMNDPVYLEAAEKLATLMAESATEPAQQLKEGFKLVTFHSIDDKNLKILLQLYKKSLQAYQQASTADSLLAYSEKKTPQKAALTITANVLLNLDRVLTKE